MDICSRTGFILICVITNINVILNEVFLLEQNLNAPVSLLFPEQLGLRETIESGSVSSPLGLCVGWSPIAKVL